MRTVLDELIARFPQAKRTTLRRMLAMGRVRVDGTVVVSLKTPLAADARVEVLEQGAGERLSGPPMAAGPFTIVYEDADLLVVNKPSGLITSSGPHDHRPTLLAYVRLHLRQTDPRARLGLIHRLDRDAAGLLVFSKSNEAYESLKTQFFKHTVTRRYVALVSPAPKPPSGEIDLPLEERADGTVYVCRKGRGQPAQTRYEVITDRGDKSAVVRLTLHTGRKHQIRVHLAHRNWPIVGDTVYGGRADEKGLHLCAVELAVDHPRTGQRMTWSIEAPFAMT
jgi:23S rRNA pseudouridine1911/1915/1917 synthase